MTENHKTVLTGGCQCGAIRFAMSVPPPKVSICHCRMCQKASGAPFASFADIEHEEGARILAVVRKTSSVTAKLPRSWSTSSSR